MISRALRALRRMLGRGGDAPAGAIMPTARPLDHASFAATGELDAIFAAHRGRGIHKWRHYFEIYERHFGPFRAAATADKPVRLLEIGIGRGGSLEMWRRYFGANALIAGLDIQPLDAPPESDGFLIEIADQQDETALRRIVERLGGVDIVIDDGSHFASHQRRSFEILYPLVAAEGLYVCEDLHAAYWDDYEGGLKRPGTFIEFTKGLIDALHGWYLPEGSIVDAHGIKETCFGLHVYDSMVVIEKRPKAAPYDILTGDPGRTAG